MRRVAPVTVALFLAGASVARGQELDPRAFSPAPIGTTIVLTGVGGSKGGILFDPSLDVTDVQADLDIVTTGVGYTFGLAGRQARVLAVFPMAWGRIDGRVHAQQQGQNLAGLVDPRLKLSVALRGAPALKLPEFGRAPNQTVIGASVTVMPPLGQYDSSRLVNLGYHRWAIKPELGFSRALGRWTVDGAAGMWFFTTNTEFFPGHSRKGQDPIGSLQGHVSYALPHRAWLALAATWFTGGETRTNGRSNADRQGNTRVGATLSIPVVGQQSLKITYSTGTTTRRGNDFNSLNVMWQLVVF